MIEKMTDSILFIVLGLILGAGGVFLAWLLFGRRGLKDDQNGANNASAESLLLLQNQLNTLIKTVDDKLGESARHMQNSIQTQFSESSKIIRDVTERLTKLDETNRQVVGFADQLQSLQDILKNPKQRGILGEYYLETLLKNVMPPGSYQMQYPFADGTIVDAAVFVKDKIIPIDSKFSLENYNRLAEEKNETERDRLEKVFVNDLKLRIQETAKYVQPDKGTLEFAFMFIPHEAIYYDLIVNKIGALKDENTENLIQRAAAKYHVIIVSPTSFLAYLQTVLQGLKALQIEESAKEIKKRVEELGKHIGAYENYLAKLGGSLGTTVNHFNSAYRELKKVDKDVLRIAGESNGFEPTLVEKPVIDE
ncbi:MAG TPA: DNA recombination protein RmuC [Candidatus Paceibacterota bacterium]|nr:DNA recombination protein RmuC [Candidatus Paceibacterota bacterium]HOY11405.1 DNA recombination protein RmuC [Candidatus Paceibacterota bacterium]HPY13249.1 DNA recombination protein RmuC [Candidatus Paceibacterota bacterium]HQB27273.1 DNA recombination protein RmuC [Candidatus Paceibacterota bacterium]